MPTYAYSSLAMRSTAMRTVTCIAYLAMRSTAFHMRIADLVMCIASLQMRITASHTCGLTYTRI